MAFVHHLTGRDQANTVTQPIHNRMPVILERDELAPWLDSDQPVSDLLKLLNPYPDSAMRAYPVSTAVNDPSNEGRGLIDSVAPSPDPTRSLFDN